MGFVMLRMSKLADYAFIILTQMLTHADENWSASTLATATGLPLPTVAKLMKLLAKSDIVLAHRGAAGGYRLAKQPKDVSIVKVIEAVDGPIGLTECAGRAKGKADCDCAVSLSCPVRESWSRVNIAIMDALEHVNLADFTPQKTC